jgi:hypothetical protein
MRVQPNAAVSGGGAEPVPAEADLEGGRSSSSCDASARSWWARARKLRAESAWEGCLPNLGPTDDRFPAIAPGRIGWHGRYTDAVADEEYVRTELCPLLERRIFFISLLLAALAFLAALTSDLSFGAASPGSVSGVLPPTRAHGLARLFYALEIPCFLALAAVAYAARRRHIHPSTPALARLAAGTLLLTFTLNVLSSSMHTRIAMAEANGTEFSARELELIMQTVRAAPRRAANGRAPTHDLARRAARRPRARPSVRRRRRAGELARRQAALAPLQPAARRGCDAI